ncbi:hypothetical protein [Nocardioides sp. GXZ039]|uniref:hypothetical protein n=1 Tax=Nocardioides sp. GXZ039 TaxID=3136018 RepID=UPI0030F45415
MTHPHQPFRRILTIAAGAFCAGLLTCVGAGAIAAPAGAAVGGDQAGDTVEQEIVPGSDAEPGVEQEVEQEVVPGVG